MAAVGALLVEAADTSQLRAAVVGTAAEAEAATAMAAEAAAITVTKT